VRRHPLRQVSPKRVRTRLTVAIAAAALILASAGVYLFGGGSVGIVGIVHTGAALPRLENLGSLAPEVADAARQALDVLAQDPRDPARWGRFGMICEANGITGAARDAYAVAASLDGSDAKWRYRLAFVEARRGQPDDAIRDLRQAIELNPTYAPAHRRLGLWLLDRNDTDGAERAFARAAELDSNDVSSSIGLARVHLHRHQDQQAVDVLERALAQHAGDRYALQLLGTAYRRLGRIDEAEYALAVGMTGEPAWPDPWTDEMLQYRRGFAVRLKDATQYFSNGQWALAIPLLEQLRQEKPDDIALLNHLGEVYVAAGRTADGVRLLEQVVARDPERFEAYVNLASGYLNGNDLIRATAAIDRAISLNPRLGRSHETRGLILWRRDDERTAVEAFRAAVHYDPRDVRAYVWKGMVEMNLGRPVDALDSFAHATHLDPTRVDAWVGIADATMNLGAWDRAAAAVQRAVQLNPDAPAVKRAAERLQSRGR
jgi:tetratricopeptide (TPR) repeat protein